MSKCVMAVANKTTLTFRSVQNYCRVGDRKFIWKVRIYVLPCTALLPGICRYNDQSMGLRIRGSKPRWSKRFFFVQNIKTSSRAHTTSSLMGNRLLSLEQSGRNMKLTNHRRLMSILQMIGAINPLLYMHSWCKEGEF